MAFFQTSKRLLSSNLNLKNNILLNGCVQTLGCVFHRTQGYACYRTDQSSTKRRNKLVILGTGWAAVSLIRSLKPGQFDISVVSPHNYFLFTPLLPSVTVGTVEGRSIAEPIRKILSRKHKYGAKYYEAECTRVNVEDNQVECVDVSDMAGETSHFSIDYDYLVVAVGAKTAMYNIQGVKEYAHTLKDIKQANLIRKHIINSFEAAAIPGQCDEEIKRMLHFVVVGGGPTGVEFAAELRDWMEEDLKKYYSADLITKSQISLIDGMNKILNTYSGEISRYAQDNFKQEGINLILDAFLTSVDDKTIHYKDAKTKEPHSMPYGMVVWCAGIGPCDLTMQIQKDIPEQNNRFGLITDQFMRVKNSRNIFSLGDCSTVQFKKFSEYVERLLDDAGIEQRQELSKEQFAGIVESGMAKYPNLCFQFEKIEKKRNKMELQTKKLTLSREDVLELADLVDTKQTALPPTAQVAAQQGAYLGELLNDHAEEIMNDNFDTLTPFQYNHLGSFAYVGKSRAVLELPFGLGDFKGLGTMFLWRGAYASKSVSLRMRWLILFDWIKAYFFGRDTSRI